MGYDVFISHASEDKAQVALPLAHYLKDKGVQVWLDEFELTLGDSLRRMIDHGLSMSRFGVVILSPAFFNKGWTNRELDGLVAREDIEKFILPIWHNVSIEDVKKFSPTLAGKMAVSTNTGIENVGEQIIRAVRRSSAEGSPVISSPVEDSLVKELRTIRSRVLEARSSWELRQLSFEADEFLSRYPHHPEARLLKEQILTAISREERSASQAAPPADFAYRSSPLLPLIIGFLVLIGFVLLLIWLIRWLF
jgi:hypothetical protein